MYPRIPVMVAGLVIATLSTGCMTSLVDRDKQGVKTKLSATDGINVPATTVAKLPSNTDGAAVSKVNAGVVQVKGRVPDDPVLPVPKMLPVPTMPESKLQTMPSGIPPTPEATRATPTNTSASTPEASVVPGAWLGSGGMIYYGPHTRVAPTAIGSLLHLGPNEMLTDRVVGLARQIDVAANENRFLFARIRELEALAINREQALNEALREVEISTTEVMKTRSELQTLRKEMSSLKERLENIEIEDIKDLQKIIDVIEKLLAQSRGRDFP